MLVPSRLEPGADLALDYQRGAGASHILPPPEPHPQPRPEPERAEGRTVDGGLRRALLHLHTTTGHPSKEALQRLLRQGRVLEKAIKAA